eukprot:3614974-Prymnesium_polylepis.1
MASCRGRQDTWFDSHWCTCRILPSRASPPACRAAWRRGYRTFLAAVERSLSAPLQWPPGPFFAPPRR